MNRFSTAKKKNSGSTIVFVIVAILFIGLLASLVLALSAASFKMRNVDYGSKRNFYEGEEYSNRIYNEVGMNAVGILGEAYVSVMGKLNSDSIRSQKELNDSLKKLYYRHMLKYLNLVGMDVKDEIMPDSYSFIAGDPVILQLETLLTSYANKGVTDADKTVSLYINDPASPADDNYVKVKADLVGYTDDEGETYPVITISDIHLQYKDSKKKFESFYTFDLVVTYPAWDFTFSNPKAASTDIDTFLDYVLINSGKLTFDGGNRSISGCVSTGANHFVATNDENYGLSIVPGTSVSFGINADNRYEPGAVVVSDNIYVNGSAVADGKMTVTGSKIWCNSIILQRDSDLKGAGPKYDASNVKHYIQDDFQIDGAFSRAILDSGVYYGFSSNRETDNQNAYNSSSSIIVNGYDSKISMNNLTKLYVNGLAYIKTKNKVYRTGESLAVKGNQDAYLVPNVYMGSGGSNPCKIASMVPEDVVENNLRNSTFFGKKWLKAGDEVTTLTYTDDNSRTYLFYYLQFSSYDAEREYVEYVLNTKPGPADTVLKEMQEQIQLNMANMHMVPETEDTTILELTNTTDGFTAGAIVSANGGLVYGSASASTIAGVTLDSISIRNRYLLMKSLLMPVVDGDAYDHEPQALDWGRIPCKDLEYKLADTTRFPEVIGRTVTRAIQNQQLNNSAFENIINLALLRQYTITEPTGIWQREHSMGTITYVTPVKDAKSPDLSISVKDGVVHLTKNYTGVIVVDGSVEIENVNLNGLLIASGDITVKGSSASAANYLLQSNPELVDRLMKAEQGKDDPCHNEAALPTSERRSNVFKFYPIIMDKTIYGDVIDRIQYSDVIYFDNWRKYEDTRSYGETS